MTTQDSHLLTGAAAVHALEGREREDVERHLQECDACALEVRELQAAAAQLGLAVAATPPVTLKARVLAHIAVTRQLTTRPAQLPPRGEPAGDVPGPGTTSPAGSSPPATVAAPGTSATARASRHWWQTPVAVAAAVLLFAVAGLGGLAAVQNRRIDQLAAAAQQRDAEQASDAARIAALVRDPDRRTVAATVQGGGTGTVVLADGQALFLGDRLASPPAGRAYQLWVIRGTTQVRSAGVLTVANGAVTQLVTDVRPADTVGLSVEPATGSPAPTTTPVLLLQV